MAKASFTIDVSVDVRENKDTVTATATATARPTDAKAAVEGFSGTVSRDKLRRMFDGARKILKASKRGQEVTKNDRNELRRAMQAVKAEYGPKGTLSDDNT